MIKRDELTQFIYHTLGEDFLAKAHAKDEVANGIQIQGQADVNKLALGVSCNQAFLKEAISRQANYCLFHHSLDFGLDKWLIPTYLQGQLRLIFQNNLTIAGFHYALDAHSSLGNNAQIIKLLGAKIAGPLYEEWGYIGKFDKPVALKQLKTQCQQLFNHPILSYETGPQTIKTIGVVSGAGKPHAKHIAEIQAQKIDLYISGETAEYIPARLVESNINYFVCGHYATETFGVKALGEVIGKHFGKALEVDFIDIPTTL